MVTQNESVATFKSLPVDGQLVALALIYTEVFWFQLHVTLKETSQDLLYKKCIKLSICLSKEQLLRDFNLGAEVL